MLLREEEQVAISLKDSLNVWYKQAIIDGQTDIVEIEELLKITHKQISYIQQRIVFLESVVDDFIKIKEDTSELLVDAMGQITSSTVF